MPLMPLFRLTADTQRRASRALALAAGVSLTAVPGFAAEATAPTPAASPAATRPAPRVLTLEDSLNIAMQNNRSVQAAGQRLEQSLARVGEANAARRVQANLQATLTRIDQKSTVELPGGAGEAPQQVTVGNLYNRTATMAITQPIDISGALRISRDIADLGVTQARLDVERIREQTSLDVKNAYYQVLRAQAALGVARANVTSLEEHLRQVRLFQQQGVVAQYDVLRAESQVANARQNVIAARNGVELAKAALNTTMGIDVTTPIEVRSDAQVTVVHPDFAESVRLANAQRASVQQAEMNTRIAERGVSLARTGNRPTLGLGVNLNANADPSAFSPRWFQWSASAIVSVPVFDSGLTRSRVRQAEADVETSRVVEQQVRDGVALEVQQAILSMNEAAERMDAAGTNVAQAAEALRLARLRYREGIATALEVTDAQAVLTQAESNEVNARYDYLLARARYEYATGQSPESQPAAAATAKPTTGAAGKG